MSVAEGKPLSLLQSRWFLSYLKPQWSALAAGSVAMLLRAGMLALVPWPLKFIIDSVIYAKPLPQLLTGVLPDPHTHRIALLVVLSLMMLGLGLADALLDYAGSSLFFDAGQRLVFRLRHDLFAHLQRLSLSFHRRHRGGDLMSRLSGDVQKLQDVITAVGGDFVQHFLVMAGVAVVMLSVDWRYGLVVLATVPALFGIVYVYTRLLRRAIHRVRRYEGDLWSMAQEVLGGVQLVQAYARERYEEHRFRAGARNIFRAGSDANELQAQFSPAMTLGVAAATAVVAWYGAIQVIDGHITAGEMLVFLAYFRSLTAPTRRVAKTARVMGRASVALERIADYLFEAPSVTNRPNALVPKSCAGRIEFEDVSFGYAPGPNILADVSFRLEPGRSVALVGPTGSGKSTIAGLISRFHDPTAGRVLLDGRDLRDLNLAFVRRQVALVLQEPVIFHASVWENICYGLEGAGRRHAVAAACAVGVDDLIARLPQGYDTLISERGQTLSGGQRQAISIARAMLSRAPIVILDEPSSSLDTITETRLLNAVHKLVAGRTALVIAHRLTTVLDADEILVLDQGRIIQRGTHARLLGAPGLYRDLWTGLGAGHPVHGEDVDFHLNSVM